MWFKNLKTTRQFNAGGNQSNCRNTTQAQYCMIIIFFFMIQPSIFWHVKAFHAVAATVDDHSNAVFFDRHKSWLQMQRMQTMLPPSGQNAIVESVEHLQ